MAGQTARAHEEIRSQISAMRDATEGAVASVRGIAEAVGRMEAVSSATAAAPEEQGAATHGIARNAATAAGDTGAAAQGIIALNAELAEVEATIGDLRAAEGAMTTQGTALRTEVTGIVTRLRAA